MKITSEHYDTLQREIADVFAPYGVDTDSYTTSYQAAGLSAKRARWDAFYRIPANVRTQWFDAVYAYANDTHIDTALRAIFKHTY